MAFEFGNPGLDGLGHIRDLCVLILAQVHRHSLLWQSRVVNIIELDPIREYKDRSNNLRIIDFVPFT